VLCNCLFCHLNLFLPFLCWFLETAMCMVSQWLSSLVYLYWISWFSNDWCFHVYIYIYIYIFFSSFFFPPRYSIIQFWVGHRDSLTDSGVEPSAVWSSKS
jgi:hypothetical protein